MENPNFQSVFFWFPYEKRYQKIPIWGKPVVFKEFNDSGEFGVYYKVTHKGYIFARPLG